MDTVGIRELQQHASKVIRDVERTGREYEVTSQGRPTGVHISRRETAPAPRGATLAQLKESLSTRPTISAGQRQALLDFVEAGRDAVGSITK